MPICILIIAFLLFHFGESKQEPDDYDCPRPDGLFANPKSCRRFYICAGGYPFKQNCPPSLYFDDIKKFCVFKNKELTCGPVDLPTEVPTTPDPLAAPKCDPAECQLPECFCSADGTRIPGGLDPDETPQMIVMTFDGALNFQNADYYNDIMTDNRRNPNGCPIKATYFVSHEYTSYFHVQQVYAKGHEIALNSISYRRPENWWTTASYENWTEEMIGMREILNKFANITRDGILGIRAPYLRAGRNEMMNMIYDYGLVYDSSLTVPKGNVPLWPYTLDYKIPHQCVGDGCPTRSFPGVWEFPLNTMHMEEGIGGYCAIADQCVFAPDDNETVYDFLMENFLRHYDTSRAPLGLYFHVNWFQDKGKVYALNRFIDNIILKFPSAWFVTMQQALLWASNPTKISGLNGFKAWACEKRPVLCNIPRTCELPFKAEHVTDMRYMQTCVACPAKYPWVKNYAGAMKGKSIMELSKGNSAEEETDRN